MSHLGRGEAAQFLSSGGITMRHSLENLRDVAHGKDGSGAFTVCNTVCDTCIFVISIPAPVGEKGANQLLESKNTAVPQGLDENSPAL